MKKVNVSILFASFVGFVCGFFLNVMLTINDTKVLRSKTMELQKKLAALEKVRAECEAKINQPSVTAEQLFPLALKRAKTYVPKSLIEMQVEEIAKSQHPLLLFAMITVESRFDPMAKSKAGALGCGQIVPKAWGKRLKEAGIIKEYRDYFDPRLCVRAAEFVFSDLLSQYGSVKEALMHYQCGNDPCQAGRQYIKDVLAEYGLLSLQLKNL